MNRVKDKVAIVTGAASGMGEASARLLAQEGAKVVISDINEVDGHRIAREIVEQGGTSVFMKHDVASESDWQRVMAATVEQFGRVDVLVNNAGVTVNKDIEETTLEEWRWVMSVNLDGVFLGVKYAIGAMKRTGGGSIINISSAGGIVGQLWAAAYNASKGGVRLLTKAAALECSKAGRDYDIRVNSIHPGCVHTGLLEPLLKKKEMADIINSLHPVGHLGEPEDIAYAVLYLASDESKFATGSELVVDGGYTAQ
ncbi:MAG: glucose 1-dehydrogenase [Actinomycetia bacterium]|nr:glucose 1-dehydrogenase [Actinomycetes bacterium]